jgi:hypothetical protein
MSTERVWPFPASRTLAAWWRQLSRWQPRSIWIAHLPIHHVEALVEVRHASPLDPLDRLVLKAVPVTPPIPVDALLAQALLGRQLLIQVLRRLEAASLVQASAGGWAQTPTGQQAVASGQYAAPARERRSFTFLHRDPLPAEFLRIRPGVSTPCPPETGWSFDPAVLRHCIAQPADWKGRVGFPDEIDALLSLDAGPEGIVIDHPENLTAVLILDADDRLLGLETKEDAWPLTDDRPLFERTNWRESFPELLRQDWQQAWQEWCQSRKLTITGPVDFQEAGHILRVTGQQLREQLSKRDDVLKGEAWLLAGSGRYRRAMLLEIV